MLLLQVVVVMALAGAAASKLARLPDSNESLFSSEEVNSTQHARAPPHAAVTARQRSEAVLDKFVDTLLASERYLKMIEKVDRQLKNLDANFNERTSSLNKYVMEILRLVRAEDGDVARARGDSPETEAALRRIRAELDGLLHSVVQRVDEHAQRAMHAHTYPTYLDNKLETIEGSVKNMVSGVDSILAAMSDVRNRPFTRITSKSDGEVSLDAASLVGEVRRVLQEQRYKKCDCKSGRRENGGQYPADCLEIQMQGFNVSGIYKIRPEEMDSFYVLCELGSAGGGWTVFQNRYDGSQDFFKSWLDYKNGFGNLAGEFWLGLEKLHYLTDQKLYELRVELETPNGHEAFAGYTVFVVGPEHEGYRISTLGTYYGSAGDSLSYHAGQKFSTPDVDNDAWADGACTSEHGGAWWYKECDKSNLNGRYIQTGDDQARLQSMYWVTFKGPSSPLARTRMMLRPLPASRPADHDQARKFIDNHKAKAKMGRTSKGQQPYAYEAPAEFFPEFV